ncbi:MAG: hypothetical protein AAGC55_11525 [Myxococcota bacterium]
MATSGNDLPTVSRSRVAAAATALILGLSTVSGCIVGAEDDFSVSDDLSDYVTTQSCEDPVGEVLRIMSCIEGENAFCASGGYASNFVKLHNTIDTETQVPGFFFWVGTFFVLDFQLDIDHAEQVGENQVSLRYVETVAFNDGDTFVQHEHALVTVDDDCKMVLWDQYGDNAEQEAVDDKADDINPF